MAHSHGELTIPDSSHILILAETTDDRDESGALTSPVGHVFRGWMKAAGIDPSRCTFSSVLKGIPLSEALTKDKSLAAKNLKPVATGKYMRADLLHQVDACRKFIDKLRPHVVVALGDLGLWATTSERSLDRSRGRILPGLGDYKVIATFAPMQVMADYPLRPIVIADLAKAMRESSYRGIQRPERFLHLEPSLLDLSAFYDEHIVPAAAISVDIETKGTMITCVGIATSPWRCLVIPFFSETEKDGNYWRTKEEERQAWHFIRRCLKTKPSFGQNFQYDMQYLWHMGIPCPLFCDDTMLLHHALQPEMRKGLGFLASIYTDEGPWKFMHKTASSDKSAKKEDV